MKKTLLALSTLALTAPALAQVVLINESLEGYPAGSAPATVNPAVFGIWPGGADQVITDSIAHGGNNSIACIATSLNAGPGDLLLKLGDKTSGSYSLSWWMYIPSGFGGYFNIQHNEDAAPASYGLDVFFEDGGTVSADANNATATGSYPQDTWFQVNLFIDFGTTTGAFLIDNTPITTWPLNTNLDGNTVPAQLGSIDFFSYADGVSFGKYYVDDINYLELPGGIGIDETTASTAFSVFPVPSSNDLTIVNERSTNAATWRLLDASGRLVMTSNAVVPQGSRSTVDIRALAAGTYSMEVLHGNSLERHLIVRN